MKQVSLRSNRVARLVRAIGFSLVVCAGIAIDTDAEASPAYGYALISEGYTRGCGACHDDTAPTGGVNTANQPFAKTMKALGLTGGGDYDIFVDILSNKIGAHDTDCDSVTDLDELTNDGDVNDPSVVPNGFTATLTPNCNDEADTTAAPDSTNGETSSTSSGTDDAFDDSSGDESGCAVVTPGSNGKASALAGWVGALGMLAVRRVSRLRRRP